MPLLLMSSGLALGANPASAQTPSVDLVTNGAFEAGLTGWEAGVASTNVKVVPIARGHAAMMATGRTRDVVITNHRSAVLATATGQRLTATAWVRTTQPGQQAKLAIMQTPRTGSARFSSTTIRTVRAWSKVSISTPAVSAGALVELHIRAMDLRPGSQFYVDNVSLVGDVVFTTGTPTPPTATAPVPGETLTNGCSYGARGIPSCGALLGSAFGGNADPAPWEKDMSHHLGIHRTYYGATGVASAVATAQKDLAADRMPWISFKLPYSWTDMADGKGDAWVTDLATRLSKLDGPVWIAFHHEPEGDGAITEWTRMQAHLAPIVRAAAPNVAYSIVLTGYHQIFGDAQYHLDSLMPKNTTIDLLGFDVYDKFGTVKNGKELTDHTDFTNDYFTKFNTYATAHGLAWGIAETGYSDKSALDNPAWILKTYRELVQTGGVAFTYFNTNLNSIAPWALSTQAKKDAFTTALRTAPTL
ncbi:MAG: cellulase family glycosylhydrolase [Nocardioidaceae bacterium]